MSINDTFLRKFKLKKIMGEEIKEKFLRAYANLPENLRTEIIVVVDEKTYTWNTVYFEVKEDTKISKKLLNTLEELEII